MLYVGGNTNATGASTTGTFCMNFSTSNYLSNALFHIKPETVPTDCMDVLARCCQDRDCSLLSQIKELFQYVEVLRKSPGKPPYCTQACHNLISDILGTKYGLDLVTCDCSMVEERSIPTISHLCQPFQSNPFVKEFFLSK